ncbi:alpha/beta-hydrolase [Anaeromyces robustus]|jgi:enterochelin esterase-like enzyme|uniref:Alpha/beta-hydrolase n=1 Tax=Anaeromyces robustus TaxID=1754192 RepID=A0A1Y1WZ02_9FUNG|nr:alpha/beta-hydrolase [Anaeromyces robustus]|eukprot:ORX78324.1 alpha/beta-hydrolase [Anaeromyces robustus]
MFKKICWTFALSALSFSVIKAENFGITLRDTTEKFSIFEEGSAATDIVQAEDGSVSWVATAAGGAGGGVAFYVKSTKEEINIANYESIDLEIDYSAVENKWSEEAKNPSFCFRVLPWDSTGMFGGFEDLEYFDTEASSGTLKHTIKIPSDYADKIIASSDFDEVLGFALKFNDYQRGNADGDQLKVQLKSVKFNAKKDAVEDKAFDDGLDDSQRGTVVEINYPTRDYTVEESALTDADKYEKHGWVYLPAGYDASDKDTKYPFFVLLHGFGQNENTWGLSNKGRGGKIKGYMDRGMASGEVEKFVLVVVTGVASKNWGPNGPGNDVNGFYAFEGEFRNDIIPYIRENFNVKEGRDNVALAGLSMGGHQTLSICLLESLDLVSNFAALSPALFVEPDDFIARVENNPNYEGLKIHDLYMTCGDEDYQIMEKYPAFVEAMKTWDRIENIKDYTYPGGTHDFPVWYHGFNDFIHMIFKEKKAEEINDDNTNTTPVTPSNKPKKTITKFVKCRVKKD